MTEQDVGCVRLFPVPAYKHRSYPTRDKDSIGNPGSRKDTKAEINNRMLRIMDERSRAYKRQKKYRMLILIC